MMTPRMIEEIETEDVMEVATKEEEASREEDSVVVALADLEEEVVHLALIPLPSVTIVATQIILSRTVLTLILGTKTEEAAMVVAEVVSAVDTTSTIVAHQEMAE
jgi:hypothetical protein